MAVIDIFWGLFHLAQALGGLYLFEGDLSWNKWVIFSLITLWAFRLSIYLYIRSIGKGEDPRYEKLAKDWKGPLALNVFFRIFCGQFFILLFTSFGMTWFFFSSKGEVYQSTFYSGVLISLFGLSWESIGDYQLLRFKKVFPSGKVMNQGLWNLSRHPNYFGEILFWWGVFISSIGGSYWGVGIISPLLVTYLLTRFSGVPMLEERHKDNPEYLDYIRTTNTLIPGKKKRI